MTIRPRPHDYSQLSNIPIPDPTIITEREIAKAKQDIRAEFRLEMTGMRETFAAMREGYVRLFEARLDGMVQRFDEKVHIALVRIDGIDQRLLERDRRFG